MRRATVAGLAGLVWLGAAQAQEVAALGQVSVIGTYDNSVGTWDAASEGQVTRRLLDGRALLRPAEILESVPGLIVTQHSGDGKANQYFLRGFNLDHGTDFATWVDGMPVNMPTHAHGQGYTDLNWLIPEVVARVTYRKGPYSASDGDFASAGSARLELLDKLPRGIAELRVGERGLRRLLLADSKPLPTGQLLWALDTTRNNGPWQVPEGLQRHSGLLRWSAQEGGSRWSLTGMAYAASWTATDQVPARAIASGLVDRFGSLDPSDGGRTARQSLSWSWQRLQSDGAWNASAYLVRSRLDLWSDFTYALDHPSDVPAANPTGIAGDQFLQSERRRIAGGALSRTWNTPLGGRDGSTTVGLQLRQDRLDPVSLAVTVARIPVATLQDSRVVQTGLGAYLSNQTQWLPWLRSIAGLRWDRDHFDVTSSIAQNSGTRSAALASPKLSLVFGPWARTEFFVNAGQGFHSNDARGTVAHVAPREGTPVDPVTPMVRTRGWELGLRTEWIPGLQSSLVLWQLALDSELVFSGDAGDTQPSRASRRAGVEWNNHWQPLAWLLLDADLAWSRARFVGDDPAGNAVPGAAGKVAALALTVTDRGRWSGSLQLRAFGPRPLVEDDSVRSGWTTLATLRVGLRLDADTRITLDVHNLLNRRASDIDYLYTSRLPGEPLAGVSDLHLHPVEPRSVRLALTRAF